MTRIRLGIDNCFAIKRWPEPAEWLRIVARELNLGLVEFTLDHIDPVLISEPGRSRICDETRKQAQAHDVEIYNTCTGTAIYCLNLLSHPDADLREDGLRWCEEAILVTTKLGARGFSGHFDELSVRDLQDPHRRELMIANLVASLKHLASLAPLNSMQCLGTLSVGAAIRMRP